MLKNYLKVAVRNLFKNKVYSIINVTGLAIGLAGFILITILIRNELSYDSFNKKAGRIYRVVEIQNQKGIGKLDIAVTMSPLAPAMKNYFPEIENTARLSPSSTLFCKIGDKGFYEKDVSFADPSIFKIFTIPFIEGDPSTALNAPFNLVITQSVAKKYFGDQDPLGKTIKIYSTFGADDFKVTGVIKDYPENSHIYFTMLGSYKTMEHYISWINEWGTNSLGTYVLLKKGASAANVDGKFPQFLKSVMPKDQWSDLQMYLQNVKDIHLYSDNIIYQTYNHNQGSITTVYIFSAIAIFILLIACINFMNLATARSAKRVKEIGMRKVLGSTRKSLVAQFLGEAVLISLMGFVLSLLLVELAMPYFKDIFGERIIFTYSASIPFIAELIGISILVGLISGSYPAFFLSKLQPAQSIKGILSGKSGGSFFRKILVTLQFAIAIALIVCTAIVSNQMNYVKNKNLGYNREHVLYLPIRSKEIRSKIDLMKTELSKNSDIVNVAAGSGLSGASGSEGGETVAGTNGQVHLMMRRSFVDFDYIKTMQMKIVQGRDFSISHPSDSSSAVIINEAAVKKFGWKNPIGKQFEGKPNKTVIGVVKDFNFFNLHSKIGPLIMSIHPSYFQYLLVRIKPDNINSTVNYIGSVWKSAAEGRPFDYSFLDQQFNEMYKNDMRTGKMFGFFSFLAIFIACLGLFGLAAYTAEQRTKEIGIRKVLGASVKGIVILLSKDFIKLVLIAGIFAAPVSYYVMSKWLQNFAYKVSIGAGTFVFAALLAFIIAFVTISVQAIKAATANPVKSIKYE